MHSGSIRRSIDYVNPAECRMQSAVCARWTLQKVQGAKVEPAWCRVLSGTCMVQGAKVEPAECRVPLVYDDAAENAGCRSGTCRVPK